MWVVKLGGSLGACEALQRWLDTLAFHGAGRVVVVPGGGRFADQVRQAQARWRFDERTAHRMALLAMHQYGLMLSALRRELVPGCSLEALRLCLQTARIPVWLPDNDLLDEAGVPASWDVTSDSLAAWLAGAIGAQHLVLVKSLEFHGAEVSLDEVEGDAVVDAAFGRFLRTAPFDVWLCGREGYTRFPGAIFGSGAAGTRLVARNRPK